MTVLIDTSVWISILRDKSGVETQRLQQWLNGREVALTRFTQLELLQGCRNETEWQLLYDYLKFQLYIDANDKTWPAAAKIFFDLRRKGITVRSPIDCCIAQIAIENDLILLHNDRDFDAIASIQPLRHLRWESNS